MAKLHGRFIIASILWTFVAPSIAAWIVLLILRRINLVPSSFVHKLVHSWSWILYPGAMLLNELISANLSSHKRNLQMKQLGCHSLIPKVKVCQLRHLSSYNTYSKIIYKGRLIGNLDVLLAIVESTALAACTFPKPSLFQDSKWSEWVLWRYICSMGQAIWADLRHEHFVGPSGKVFSLFPSAREARIESVDSYRLVLNYIASNLNTQALSVDPSNVKHVVGQ